MMQHSSYLHATFIPTCYIRIKEHTNSIQGQPQSRPESFPPLNYHIHGMHTPFLRNIFHKYIQRFIIQKQIVRFIIYRTNPL